jgi:hypothetical protein
MGDKDLTKINGDRAVIETDADQFVVPGMENVQPSELRIPLLKLVQAQSQPDGATEHLGEWHNSVTGEFSSAPEVLIIGVARGRVMFPAQYSAENKPLCGSDDGANPRQEYIGQTIKAISEDENGEPIVVSVTIPRTCVGCPFAVWGQDGKPPRCNEVATFAGMLQEGLPVLMQIKSTGMKNVPNLKTLIAANGIRKAIRLGSVQEKNETGIYYVPVFLVGGKPNKEWQATAMRLARLGNLAARNQQAVIEYEHRQAEPPEGAPDAIDEDAAPYYPDDLPF